MTNAGRKSSDKEDAACGISFILDVETHMANYTGLPQKKPLFHYIKKVYDHSGEEVSAEYILDAFDNISVPT